MLLTNKHFKDDNTTVHFIAYGFKDLTVYQDRFINYYIETNQRMTISSSDINLNESFA